MLAAIVLLTVIVGLAAWWWNGGSFDGVLPTGGTAAPAPEPSPTSVQPAAARAQPEPERVVPVPEQRPMPLEDAGPAVEPPAPDAQRRETAALAEVADENDDARAGPAVTIPLDLVFDAESWAEITDARGERLLFGLNAAGRNVTVRGEPPFSIVLGNAEAVRLTVDGAPYTIPRTGRQGNLARFSVDIAEE